MQCLMCVTDHLANAMENWRAMCRNPDYARSPGGEDSHLCDFRADICQAEAQCWQEYMYVSKEIRVIKKWTEDVLTGGDVVDCQDEHNIFDAIRCVWELVMEIRDEQAKPIEPEEAGDDTPGAGAGQPATSVRGSDVAERMGQR